MTNIEINLEAVEIIEQLRNSKGWPKLGNAAADRIEQLEAAIDRIEASHGLTSNGNLWRFWSTKAQEVAGNNVKLRDELTRAHAATAAAYELAAKLFDDGTSVTGAAIGRCIRALATPDQTAALDKLIAEAVEPYAEALRVLISHTHECERELTEALYHADFCGESRPLTDARAILAASKKGGV